MRAPKVINRRYRLEKLLGEGSGGAPRSSMRGRPGSRFRPPLPGNGPDVSSHTSVLDQVVHHGGVGQGGDVTQCPVLGHIPEQAAHDLARAGLWQPVSELDLLRCHRRTETSAGMAQQGTAQGLVAGYARLEGDERLDDLAGDRRGQRQDAFAIRTGNRVGLRQASVYAWLILAGALISTIAMQRALEMRDYSLAFVQEVGSSATSLVAAKKFCSMPSMPAAPCCATWRRSRTASWGTTSTHACAASWRAAVSS